MEKVRLIINYTNGQHYEQPVLNIVAAKQFLNALKKCIDPDMIKTAICEHIPEGKEDWEEYTVKEKGIDELTVEEIINDRMRNCHYNFEEFEKFINLLPTDGFDEKEKLYYFTQGIQQLCSHYNFNIARMICKGKDKDFGMCIIDKDEKIVSSFMYNPNTKSQGLCDIMINKYCNKDDDICKDCISKR